MHTHNQMPLKKDKSFLFLTTWRPGGHDVKKSDTERQIPHDLLYKWT
jgi:hypothetical protein